MPALLLVGLVLWLLSAGALAVLWMGWGLIEGGELSALERTLFEDAAEIEVHLQGPTRRLPDADFDPAWIWQPGPVDGAPRSRALAAEMIAAEREDFGRALTLREPLLAQIREDGIDADSEDPWDRLLAIELLRRDESGRLPEEQLAILRMIMGEDAEIPSSLTETSRERARLEGRRLYGDAPEHPAGPIALMYALHLSDGEAPADDPELAMALVRGAQSIAVARAALNLAATRYRGLAEWGDVSLERLEAIGRAGEGSDDLGPPGVWVAERAAAATLQAGDPGPYRSRWRGALTQALAEACPPDADAACPAEGLVEDLDAWASALEAEGWRSALEAAIYRCSSALAYGGEGAAIWEEGRWIWVGQSWRYELQACLSQEAAAAAAVEPPPEGQKVWISTSSAAW